MTEDDLIVLSILNGATNALSISQDIGLDARYVQSILHRLDDEGIVILTNGFYHVSEYKKYKGFDK